MQLIEKSLRYPVTVVVAVVTAFMVGVLAFSNVPVRMTPTVNSMYLSIDTFWENANPKQIESEVVSEQEQVLGNIEGLISMVSSSRNNRGNIVLEFDYDVELEQAMQQVAQKLDEVPFYPGGVTKPIVSQFDPSQAATIAWAALSSSDPNFDTTTLYSFMDRRLRPRLERIPGIAKVGMMGAKEQDITIVVDTVKMASLGLSYSQLVTVLRQNNVSFSGGTINNGKLDVQVSTTGRFKEFTQLENLVIKRTELGSIQLSDFAHLQLSYKEAKNWVRVRGISMPMFSFDIEHSGNVLEVMTLLKTELKSINAENGVLAQKARELGLNGELELIQTYDTSIYVENAIELVLENILLGGLFATATLFLFIRNISAIAIISVVVPISIVSSVIVLIVSGRSINIVSLSGMAFAVGMVIDSAIVVLENIYRHKEMGKQATQAALDGTKEVAPAIFASTLTTVTVFIPILLIQDSAGQLFRDLALAIMGAVSVSFLVSIVVIPTLAAKLFRQSNANLTQPKSYGLCLVTSLPEQVTRIAAYLIGHWQRAVTTVLLLAVLTVSGIKYLMPPLDYLPTGNFNAAIGLLIPPPGYSLDKMNEIGRQVEDNLRPAWQQGGLKFLAEARDYSAISGDAPTINVGDSSIAAPAIEHFFMGAFDGKMFQAAMPVDDQRTVDLVTLLDQSISSAQVPDVINFAFQLPLFPNGGATGSAISIHLKAEQLDLVNRNAATLMGALVEKFGPYSVAPEPANFSSPIQGIELVPDDERLQAFGLTREELGLATAANGDGIVMLRVFELGGELKDLKIQTKQVLEQESLQALLVAPIATPDGRVTDVTSVTEVRKIQTPEEIRHVDRLRAVTLQFTPSSSLSLEQAIEQVSELITTSRLEGRLDNEVEVVLSGSAGKLTEIKEALLGDGSLSSLLSSSLFLALLFVYLILVVFFQSWGSPLLIMVTVPLATLGGFIGISLVHASSVADRYQAIQNLDMLSIIGFVILAGVVVNNAILIVNQTTNLLKENNTLDYNDAILAGLQSRVRPILMSALTSIGGMLPLVLVPGAGSELYRGIGSVVVGGLFVATLFTFFLTPTLLSLSFKLKAKYGYPVVRTKSGAFV
ncbi:Multidrug resistance protein MdtB [Pseudoalteromonas sp. CIP111854]|uniref:Multidrug resistance protein MdtB n=1 Tax=Pseudoalteromonas holothuriae TaxID=2963714 RepID=A0A9W4QYA8_9GAMM|nr:efflux RND transporter permease subunit [Pseudoalteromonas sp. CIP111854]CAH9058793.1 Multidrug resistance protein MdtB [Pseudoalteromonas sp. CIP111854]